MGIAILRGSKSAGYRTSVPLDCPHCSHPVEIAGRVDEDKRGPHLVLWPVANGGYTPRELDYVVNGPPRETGVALPQRPGATVLIDDPVPDFSGDRGA